MFLHFMITSCRGCYVPSDQQCTSSVLRMSLLYVSLQGHKWQFPSLPIKLTQNLHHLLQEKHALIQKISVQCGPFSCQFTAQALSVIVLTFDILTIWLQRIRVVWDTILCLWMTEVKHSLYRPVQARGLKEVQAPKFQDSQHKKFVRLSALCTGHLYPQELFLVLISVRG